MSGSLKRALRREGNISGVYAIVRVLKEMNETDATVLEVTRSNEPARRWTYTGITEYSQFVLNLAVLDYDADADDVLPNAWRVRTLSGMGDAIALESGAWRRVEPRLSPTEAKELLLAAVHRCGKPQMLRDAVVHFVDEHGFASNSAAFGDERGAYYGAVMRSLDTAMKKYAETVRATVGAGGQRKPHTLARFLALCEYEQQRAEKAAHAGAGGSGGTTPAAAHGGGAGPHAIAPRAPAPLPASDATRNNAAAPPGTGATAAGGSAAGGSAAGACGWHRDAGVRRDVVDPRACAIALGGPRPTKRTRAAPP